MQVHIPDSIQMIELRDRLLQDSLRDADCPFDIRDEYPIVLSPDNTEYSHVLVNQGEIIAHLNIWPRVLVDRKLEPVAQIGLIGNVATHPNWRGQGVMRQMFEWLDRERGQPEFDAMVLWSDLNRFYQNLGYRSQAKEFRALLPVDTLARKIAVNAKFLRKEDLTPAITPFLEHCLALRPELPFTLYRDAETFRQLLQIPATMLFYLPEDDSPTVSHSLTKPKAYAIIGKGYDMVGVVHEWGGEEPEDLLALIGAMGQQLQAKQLMLLLPEFAAEVFKRKIGKAALSVECHSMALCKIYQKQLKEKLDKMFVWGLDSI